MGYFVARSALALLLLGASTAAAQLPTAAGRAITLSRPQWKLFVPEDYAPRPDHRVDLLVHFHGDPQTVWNNAAQADLNAVVVTVNYSGLSSAYRVPFSDASLFGSLLQDARSTLIGAAGFDPASQWGHTAVSSFSAGYGAVREILGVSSYFDDIDAVLAADSLYATTAADGTALDSQMAGYKRLANEATAGAKRFVFTHSQVQTFTYESTGETGDELLDHLDLAAEPLDEAGLGPLRYYRGAGSGNFALWGAVGAGATDHLNHLRYIGEWLGDLGLARHGLEGDLNGDGVVDAADYTAWRDNYPGHRTAQDYGLWRSGFGTAASEAAAAVPEPATFSGVAVSAGVGFACRRGFRPQRHPRARLTTNSRGAGVFTLRRGRPETRHTGRLSP